MLGTYVCTFAGIEQVVDKVESPEKAQEVFSMYLNQYCGIITKPAAISVRLVLVLTYEYNILKVRP
jgi:hypothetical protein